MSERIISPEGDERTIESLDLELRQSVADQLLNPDSGLTIAEIIRQLRAKKKEVKSSSRALGGFREQTRRLVVDEGLLSDQPVEELIVPEADQYKAAFDALPSDLRKKMTWTEIAKLLPEDFEAQLSQMNNPRLLGVVERGYMRTKYLVFAEGVDEVLDETKGKTFADNLALAEAQGFDLIHSDELEALIDLNPAVCLKGSTWAEPADPRWRSMGYIGATYFNHGGSVYSSAPEEVDYKDDDLGAIRVKRFRID